MPNCTVSYLWHDLKATEGFRSGVSLHSHTNQSQETLDFLANLGNRYPWIRPFLARMETRAKSRHGLRIDYARSYWTPPMTPKLAFDLERKQIEDLGLRAMVSITDHDNINWLGGRMRHDYFLPCCGVGDFPAINCSISWIEE